MELAGLFLGCGGALVGLFVGLLLASVVLRGAVALANRLLGPVKPPDMFGQWDDRDSDEPAPKPRKNQNRAIPEPDLATGMLVAFISGIVNACGYIVCVVLAEEMFDLRGLDEWVPFAMLLFFSLPLTGLILTLVLTVLLPTTFWRATLVAFLHYVIVFVIAFVAAGAVFLALGAVGP